MTPGSVVCWLWKPQGRYRSHYTTGTVNDLYRMVQRHYQRPHRFLCVTDMTKGLDSGIEVVPAWNDFADVPSPYGAHQPSCYRRLRAFHPDIAQTFGERFVSLDLDTVVVGDLTALWDRPEEFIAWGETNRRSFYNGSLWMMTAGSRRQVWDRFDPKKTPQAAKAAGNFGSDQGTLSWILGKGEAIWTTDDGVYSYKVHLNKSTKRLPPNARLVMFHGVPWGGSDPGYRDAQQLMRERN